MRTFPRWFALALGCAAVWAWPAMAQDWTTLGNDAQRSGWLRASAKISTGSVHAPDFQMIWKRELDAKARGDSSITPPVLLDFLISHKGFRSLAFLGGADGSVFAIDTDLNRLEWERRFAVGDEYPAPTAACPGGMTTSVTRPTVAALPAFSFAGPRRRSPGFSGVGKPDEGAVTLKRERSPGFRRPEPPKPDARQQAPARRSLFGLKVVYAVTADGMFRTMLVSNGYDHGSPMPFLPPNANARGLMLVDGVAYVATANGCGGVANGVWSLDTESGKVSSWKAGSASVAGSGGFAMAPGGTVYAATTDGRVVALEGAGLEETAAHKASGTNYVSAPIVIDYNDQDYLAVASRDGAVSLFAAADLQSGPVAKTPTDSAGFGSEALATWRDPSDVTWVLAPKAGAVEAWKIVDANGKLSLEQGWKASLAKPLPPIIANGVVFAAAAGSGSSGAVLYAFDGVTGRKLWDSGNTIAASAPASGLTAGPNTIYFGTHDGALYAFGFPIEH